MAVILGTDVINVKTRKILKQIAKKKWEANFSLNKVNLLNQGKSMSSLFS